jgi:hypothetical protein
MANLNDLHGYPEDVEVCAAITKPANPTCNPGYNPGTYAAVVSDAPAIDVKTPTDGE